MILIHTALLCEAQSFIEYYKLKKVNSKIYTNGELVILISGIGKQNTISTLEDIFLNYNITKALNIGIAGCNNTKIQIGNLYCTNQILKEIPTLALITNDEITTDSTSKDTTLYDMEAKYFHTISLEHLKADDIFIFKIVSDYLSCEILQKDYIKSLITKQKIIHQFIKQS
ncbi:MAG: nucleoside phosphorylase [Arcobacteraceae bacterium]|jgi:nucleoside phosphorylase